MASLKWDFHNWVTVLLMVGVAYVAFGLVRSAFMGGGTVAEG
jgi:hypothetical protein